MEVLIGKSPIFIILIVYFQHAMFDYRRVPEGTYTILYIFRIFWLPYLGLNHRCPPPAPRIPSDLLSFSEDLLPPGEAATAAKKLEIVKGQVAQMNGSLGLYVSAAWCFFPRFSTIYIYQIIVLDFYHTRSGNVSADGFCSRFSTKSTKKSMGICREYGD